MDLKQFALSRADYFKNILTPPENWNKLIDITLKAPDASEQMTIRTPRAGRKPNIEIRGVITSKNIVNEFEIRITNLYVGDKILSDYHEVEVYAGYEKNMSMGLNGTILNIYNESPGPDKVTVIQCTTASFNAWVNTTVNLNLEENFKLTDALKQISNALNFKEPYVDQTIQTQTSVIPLKINGSAKEAVSELEKLFPLITIMINSNTLNVYPKNGKVNAKVHQLPLLIQAPQFAGKTVNLIAPWKPEIAPGDIVKFSTNYYTTSIINSDTIGNTAQVNQIEFNFSTHSTNEMHITGFVQ